MSGAIVRYSLGLSLLAGLALLAAGCGGSSASPSVANVPTTTSRLATRVTTTAQAQPSALKYSECMRAHGVRNFPDPSSSGGFSFPAGSLDRSSPAFKAAQATCQKYFGAGLAPGSSTQPSSAWLTKMVKAAQCMRAHGVPNFPDPMTKIPSPLPVNGVVSDIEGAVFVFTDNIDQQSPVFVHAAAVCGFPTHNH